MFNRLQDALTFILAAFSSTLFSATLGTLLLSVVNRAPFDTHLSLGLWIGHMVSVVSFGPFMMRWVYKPLFTRTVRELLEGTAVFASIILLNVLLYWTPYLTLGSVSLLYLSIVPLVWAALRTGPRGMSLALLLMATIAATGILFGHGPLSQVLDLPQELFSVQLIIGTLSLIFLIFSAIVEERKEANNTLLSNVVQLQDALEKIRAEDKAKADFIAILAHELRNPLSPLLSGLELMKIRGQGSPDLLKMMGSHLNTMARLLDDLLDMARVSQQKFKLQVQPVRFSDVVAQSAEMVEPLMAARGHTLTTVVPEQELWFNGDQVRLVQILVNLLNNAAKYTNPGGKVRLEARTEGEWAVITVTDSGVGIEAGRLKKYLSLLISATAG